MELKIYIRQQRTYNRQNQQVYWQGTNPSNLQQVIGSLPPGDPRAFPNYPNWVDVTDSVSDLHALKLQWSDQRDNEGEITPETQIKKGTSGAITFEGEAYRLVRKWMVEDVSAPLNGIEVMIDHVGVGRYEGYCIKYADIEWCEGDICTFNLNIKQMDERLACIRSTVIYDNHQGWFQNQPKNGKKHPRFSYCREQSAGMLAAIWYVMSVTYASMWPIILLLGTVYNTIAFIIKAIEAAVNAIISIVGGQPKDWGVDYMEWNDIRDFWAAIMVESSGCGREHPAPLIRDYIFNVCDKCGVTVNADTAPIFFAQNMTFRTGDPTVGNGGEISGWNPYYNACFFWPNAQKGIRRYNKWNVFDAPQKNTTDYYTYDNRPQLYLDKFLEMILPVFNAQWMVRDGMLYINRKDWFIQNTPLYDFRNGMPDRSKIVEGVCFENTERKYPAWVKGIWSTDASDMSGSLAGGDNGTGQANGIYEYANSDSNPAYEGEDDKTLPLMSAAHFRFDGITGDYIYDAAQMVFNAGITSFIIPGSRIVYENSMRDVVAELDEYCDYALLLSGETVAKAKILIWDGQSYEAARCWRGKKAGASPITLEPEPTPNDYYNKGVNGGHDRSWKAFHNIDTKVSGSALTFNAQPDHTYIVRGMGGQIVARHAALLVNYPMFFDPNFRETLFDYFHWIDDPRRNITLNRRWRVKLELCVDDLNKMRVFNDAHGININQPVRLEHGFHNVGVIREVEVSYDPSDTYGRYIQLSGTL